MIPLSWVGAAFNYPKDPEFAAQAEDPQRPEQRKINASKHRMSDGFSNAKELIESRFAHEDLAVESERSLYEGFFDAAAITLRHRRFDKNWSEIVEREVFHRAQAVAIVPYDPVLDAIGLVDQFRAGLVHSSQSPWTLEGVAGMRDKHFPDEPLDALARRELVEEAGIKDCHLIPITQYFSTPGGCGESIQLFCALCDLANKRGSYGLVEEHEDLYFHVFRADDVFEQLYTGRLNNAATLISLQWLQAHRAGLRDKAAEV